MKLPMIRLRLKNSRSKTKHTLAQMEFCYDCSADRSGVEIYSVEKDCRSIKEKGTGLYIMQVTGHSYDSETMDSKHLELWYNSGLLPYTDNAFDLKLAMSFFNMPMYQAIKDFNFVLKKTNPDYLSLREDYDRCVYLNTLTKDQRAEYYQRDYDFMDEARNARIAKENQDEATLTSL
tara:strand:+ start:32 stop:562 length:531 start_codon:yes stop_codon:yes gene_type:complete